MKLVSRDAILLVWNKLTIAYIQYGTLGSSTNERFFLLSLVCSVCIVGMACKLGKILGKRV